MNNTVINFKNTQEENGDAFIDESSQEFQKFIYDLFEKNGVLTDLRAHLRERIVNVLRHAQSGDIPKCQKNFTQRLTPSCQALNILIAEYLLRQEFSYTLSVFVSEIPLANMVFNFAKKLMALRPEEDYTHLHFKDDDLWAILNNIGIQLDLDQASLIVNMYRKGGVSLLVCILKCIPLVGASNYCRQDTSTDDSVSSSLQSCDTHRESRTNERHKYSRSNRCKHQMYCKSCQSRISHLKEKYKKKWQMSRQVIEQLKNVYETEIELVRSEEKSKVKASLANHTLMLKQQRDEMEASLSARQAQLEANMQQRKRFLWQLARGLRAQHDNLARAMVRVAERAKLLADRENSVKAQLQDAETTIKKRGEEIRAQISTELDVLVEHMENLKKERDSLNGARTDLNTGKAETDLEPCDGKGVELANLKYEELKNEIKSLKNYLETTKLCTVVENSTNTELKGNLNNVCGVDASGSDEKKSTPNQLLNDLRKPKNVNQSQTELYQRKNEENDIEIFKNFSRQQSAYIEELMAQQSRLQAELRSAQIALRMAEANARLPEPYYLTVQRAAANSSYPVAGGGEELQTLIQPRPILVPGDNVPFIGPLGGSSGKRHFINPSAFRKLHGNNCPQTTTRRPASAGSKLSSEAKDSRSDVKFHSSPTDDEAVTNRGDRNCPELTKNESITKLRKMSTEASQCLSNNKELKKTKKTRDKSPDEALEEARLRLKKLEIEARAVEESYLEYRKRRTERKSNSAKEKPSLEVDTAAKILDRGNSLHRITTNEDKQAKKKERMKRNVDILLKNYKENYDAYFKNRNGVQELAKPIPNVYSELGRENQIKDKSPFNYLDAPMTEFRKNYASNNKVNTHFVINYKNFAVITDENSQNNDAVENISVAKEAIANENETKSNAVKNIPEIAKEAIINVNERIINENTKNNDKVENILRTAKEAIANESERKSNETPKNNDVDNIGDISKVANKNNVIPLKTDDVKNESTIKTESPVVIGPNDSELKIYGNEDPVIDISNEPKKDTEHEMELIEHTMVTQPLKEINKNTEKEPQKIETQAIEDIYKNESLEHNIETLGDVKTPNNPDDIFTIESENAIRIIVEDSVDTKQISEKDNEGKVISTEMTIIISPKSERIVEFTDTNNAVTKLRSPEVEANLNRGDVYEAIFSKNKLDNGDGKDNDDSLGDYEDDFSVDSKHDYVSRDYSSPISVQKTDDDKFWDS